MLNREAIRRVSVPKDGNFRFNIAELQALLPAGKVDRAVKPVYEEVSIGNTVWLREKSIKE